MSTISATRFVARTKSLLGRALTPSPASWYPHYRLRVVVTDAVMLLITVLVTFLSVFGDDVAVRLNDTDVPYSALGILFGVLWLVILETVDSRSRTVFGAGLEEYRRVINAGLYAVGVIAICASLAQADLSRGFFITMLPIGIVLLLTGRWLVRRSLNAMRRDGRGLTPAVIVGEESDIRDAVRDMTRFPEAGFKPAAICVPGGSGAGTSLASLGLRVVEPGALRDLVDDGHVGAVAVAGGLSRDAVRRLSWSLENSPVELLFVPQLTDVAGPRISVRKVEGLGLLQVDLPRYSGWNHLLKRGFDIVFSALALLLLSPVLLAVAVAIKVDDGGPVLFRQQRVGLRGEPFTIHKFRTMSLDAEAKIDSMIAAAGGTALLFKVEDDPRVTRLGRLLRKYSLDELPQFWTVLRGQMSVVGPRPQVAREVAEYNNDTYRRLLTKPGITGLWQVSGRSDLSIEDSIRLDLSYVENWSLTGDVAIILRTVKVVLFPNGAY